MTESTGLICDSCSSEALLVEAVRTLRVADPDLGVKSLLAKLREQQQDLGAGSKEVRVALRALATESKAAKAATLQPAADEGVSPAADEGAAPSHAALSLACAGCARTPSALGKEKHEICSWCRDRKLPTTYFCGIDCPANPFALLQHAAYHKELKKRLKTRGSGGVAQQRNREVAEEQARLAARTGAPG